MNILKTKKYRFLVIIPIAVMLLILALNLSKPLIVSGTRYYVSQTSGSNNWDGKAPVWDGTHGPWKTLLKASSITYQPGDSLLLKCGDIWSETLSLKGDGTPKHPITVASYGKGERPYIKLTKGYYNSCIIVDKGQGYTFKGIEMGYSHYGINLAMDYSTHTVYDYFRIEDCFFHDIENSSFPAIKGELSPWAWAIYRNPLHSTDVNVKNVLIKNCFAMRCQGFYNENYAHSQENVLFDGCTIAYGHYNNLYQSKGKNFDIRNCVFVYAFPPKYWPYGNTHIVAGNCEGDAGEVRNEVINCEFGWTGDYAGGVDGCAYDYEYNNSGMTFQNNYVHNTFGEAILFMSSVKQDNLLLDNNIFRNNVVYNKRFNSYISLPGSVRGSGTISNNKFFLLPERVAFSEKPKSFTFIGNDENAVGEFVEIPKITGIQYGEGTRTYTLSCDTSDAVIRYTTDGSIPVSSSTKYTGSITFDKTCVLNVKAFKKNCYNSYTNSLVIEMRDSEGQPPYAWWKLNEASGTTASDSAGSNTGTVYGAAWKDNSMDNGLEFDGVDDYVLFTGSKLSSISDDFTLSFWANPKAERALTDELDFGIKAGMEGQRYALFPEFRGGGPDSNHAGVGVSVGTNGISVFEHSDKYIPSVISGWVHIAIVYRDKQPLLFVDGIPRKVGYRSTKEVHPNFRLGGTDYGWYKGGVNDVRVYDRILTNSEIQMLAFLKKN